MSDPVEAGVDAGLMAAADAVMDAVAREHQGLFGPKWRGWPAERSLRDAIHAALLTERRRAEAAMRERADAALAAMPAPACPFDGPHDLDPETPCPVCGDLGTAKAADGPSNCGNPLYAYRLAIKALPLTEDTHD